MDESRGSSWHCSGSGRRGTCCRAIVELSRRDTDNREKASVGFVLLVAILAGLGGLLELLLHRRRVTALGDFRQCAGLLDEVLVFGGEVVEGLPDAGLGVGGRTLVGTLGE